MEVSPSGANKRSRITTSQTLPVTTSITRPRIENPVLQYDIVAPSGWVCSRDPHEATYRSRQSSPRPKSAKLSPSIPLVCDSRWRSVTVAGHVEVGDGEVGEVGPHGGVDVEEPLVDELHDDRGRPHLALRPDLEDRVGRRLDAGTQVGEPGRCGGHLTVVEHTDGGARDVVLLDKGGQPWLQVSERHRSTRRPWWRAVPRRGRSRFPQPCCARSTPSSLCQDRR